ncbi:hypothetical protein [Solicola sp. PLA-1-18]|uniref:hypothetical protein n=1 Tax=Solicola sp. PLA-1-18 TaxID=3380532 RepID=UPI003B7A310C
MATRGRRRAERVRRKARPDDGLVDGALDVPASRWRSSRRRARTLVVVTTALGLLVWAACCAVVQTLWPPLLLSPGGLVVVLASSLLAAAGSYRLGRRLAARAVRTTLDELRAVLSDTRPTQPRWWTHDQHLDLVLGRETVLLRRGRRVVVSADVHGGAVLLATSVAVTGGHGYPVDPAVPGTYVDFSGAGGWSDGGGGGGGDGGGGGSC